MQLKNETLKVQVLQFRKTIVGTKIERFVYPDFTGETQNEILILYWKQFRNAA
jgi:hypothetical protein